MSPAQLLFVIISYFLDAPRTECFPLWGPRISKALCVSIACYFTAEYVSRKEQENWVSSEFDIIHALQWGYFRAP
jgi:hypothetical protein